MTTLSLQSPFPTLHISPLSLSTFAFLSPSPTINLPKLGFCTFNSLRASQFRTLFEPPTSLSAADNALSDADNALSYADEDDDFDDDEAADEYEDVSGEGSGDGVVDEEVVSEEEEEFNAAFWSSEETKLQRVKKLCDEVREFGDGFIDVNELASIYDFRIDKFQKQAIKAFLRGSSVVVSAPTSSGKTLIAEAAAVATVARGKRLLYTTPLKALSNQKFREFRDTFGDSNVGLLTGDSAINKDAQVLIMTTEILRNMLYQSVGGVFSGSGLFDVDVIVLDEVHYLSDMSRGTVWEETVIYCPKEVQLICLSATVANPDELAGWIGQIHGKTELVTSLKRPVPLTWHFSTKAFLLPLLDEKGTSMNRKLSLSYLRLYASGEKSYRDEGSRRRNSRRRRDESDLVYEEYGSFSGQSSLSKNDVNMIRRSLVPQVEDTLEHLKGRDMLPAVWFIFSRKGCDAAVQYVENSKLLDECEKVEVELALKRFRIQYPDAVREPAVKGLLRGVAAHHAGCLPLWKSFIEELFQRGLIKVVFATETLAAGINMPARTAVIASLSKRTEAGRARLRSNELLQMAGRAGRRGIDEKGHVVLVQSPYEGAEECCELLFSGMEPLVSQFTASYGMVLNLLGGAKVTRQSNEADNVRISQAGRTVEEARKLVEQSFGNYLGSNVMLASKEELGRVQKEIELLTAEVSEDAMDRRIRKLLSDSAYREIVDLQEELREEKRIRVELRRKMELERMSSMKPLLNELGKESLPFLCLEYKDTDGIEHSIVAVYLSEIDSLDGSKLKNLVQDDHSFKQNIVETESSIDAIGSPCFQPSYHVALGSDNSWYLFTEKWIKAVYTTGFPNMPLNEGDALPRELMTMLLDKEGMEWAKLADSELGGLWNMEGSLDTWTWTLNVPMLSSLSEEDKASHMSPAQLEAVERYRKQRNKVSHLKKKITRTEGFREFKKIDDMAKIMEGKIRRLKNRQKRLIDRIEQIEPSGWKEFLQISNVIHETRALDINTNVIFPLGETASAIRGENELWLAMVLRNKVLVDLNPAQLAAVCGSLVSEGIKIRSWKNNGFLYEPSSTVVKIIHDYLEEQREYLLDIQDRHGVQISCCLDSQFSGMVEAWASGLTWREIMMDCALDEGDLARLFRRTIDLLAQIPKMPDIDPVLQSNAMTAAGVMDRSPISELAGY